jgi:hypothetical protein
MQAGASWRHLTLAAKTWHAVISPKSRCKVRRRTNRHGNGTGLNPEETEGRITTVYERILTTTVDNIEHIESTTVNGTAIVKIYLQPSANIDRANAQITAVSQTIFTSIASRLQFNH